MPHAGSYDASVRIWDCRSNSRDPVQILQDASDSVSSVQFSTYELLAASVDGCVRVYDIRMGRLDQDNLGGAFLRFASRNERKNGVLIFLF
jgi:mitogen-activated protein kinase organizer 1